MTVKTLENVPFESIMNCFLASFKNYFVEMPTDFQYYKKRWKNAKVRYDLSYGMFDNDILIGFIIHGIDERNGEVIAFNTGTGVLPEYRGKRIAKSIYKYAIEDLKRQHITKCSLEVIQDNIVAIKSYESIGFQKCKHYKCFKGELQKQDIGNIDLKEITYDQMNWDSIPHQEFYSWDNHKNSIKNGDYRYIQIIKDNIPESYFIINSSNGYLAQFDVLCENQSSWDRLFSGIKAISNTVKINNVDDRLDNKLKYLNAIGLKNTVDQYEMELKI
ncbi:MULTISPECIES: GNAT family N-acetyltransferase [Aquimarina]|uniref:GNAT family N-acetyltransferase n=1 Tax=Aquimarina algiphila TaxID=2047982 RepID=A0A554VCK6_9FLAO|nr:MULTISPECIES: GNAT family N-acetyltransferase [Aquimarina]TSE04437.1 GNAT family N-acetyltransferase [Aquimarina algiphila]